MKCGESKFKLLSKSVNSISVRSIRDVCKRNLRRIILGHLNINSIRNKFFFLVWAYKPPQRRKLEHFGQFKIPGYALPSRLDCNQFDSGIMVFVIEGIPSRILSLNKSKESLLLS